MTYNNKNAGFWLAQLLQQRFLSSGMTPCGLVNKLSTKLRGITSQNTVIVTVSTMKTCNYLPVHLASKPRYHYILKMRMLKMVLITTASHQNFSVS